MTRSRPNLEFDLGMGQSLISGGNIEGYPDLHNSKEDPVKTIMFISGQYQKTYHIFQ